VKPLTIKSMYCSIIKDTMYVTFTSLKGYMKQDCRWFSVRFSCRLMKGYWMEVYLLMLW